MHCRQYRKHFVAHRVKILYSDLQKAAALERIPQNFVLNILVQDTKKDPPDSFDVKLLDGAAVVHFLPCTNIVTFDKYAERVFVPDIMKQLEHSKRIDVG